MIKYALIGLAGIAVSACSEGPLSMSADPTNSYKFEAVQVAQRDVRLYYRIGMSSDERLRICGRMNAPRTAIASADDSFALHVANYVVVDDVSVFEGQRETCVTTPYAFHFDLYDARWHLG